MFALLTTRFTEDSLPLVPHPYDDVVAVIEELTLGATTSLLG